MNCQLFVPVCVAVKESTSVADGWTGIDWPDVPALFKLAPRRSFKRSKAWVWVKVAVEALDEELLPLEELEFEAVAAAAPREALDENVDELAAVAELEDLLDEELESSETVFTCCFFVVEFFFEAALLLALTLPVVSLPLADLLLLQAANERSIAPATIEVNSLLAFIIFSSQYLELWFLITL